MGLTFSGYVRGLLTSAAFAAVVALAGCETDGLSTTKEMKELSPEMRDELSNKNMPIESAILVRLFPRTLELAGPRPFNTACGSWRYTLSLDRRATQRISQLVLRPDAGDPLAGELSGVLPLAAVLHFEDVNSARRIDLPLTLRLELTGRWGAVPLPLAAGALAPAASNLVFFADSSRGWWSGRRECVRLSPFVGEVCLSAAARWEE